MALFQEDEKPSRRVPLLNPPFPDSPIPLIPPSPDNPMTLSTRVTAGPDHLSSNLAGEVVILSLDRGLYYGLDEVGARIWEMLSDTPVTPEQICDRLETEYDVDRATLESDILDLLEDLHAEGIVHTSVAVE